MKHQGLGITLLWNNKPRTLEQYIEYRNMIVRRAKARTAMFQDHGKNYYWLRLIEIDSQFPQFKGLGIIKLKNSPESVNIDK